MIKVMNGGFFIGPIEIFFEKMDQLYVGIALSAPVSRM